MSIDNLKEALPEYAKDLKLNLGSISRTTVLNEEQLWGALLASAAATRPGWTTSRPRPLHHISTQERSSRCR